MSVGVTTDQKQTKNLKMLTSSS